MSKRKPLQRSKRRHGGKIKRLNAKDRYLKQAHDRRTDRLKRLFEKKKVVPDGSKVGDNDAGRED